MKRKAGCDNKFVITAKLLSILANIHQDSCCYLLVPGNSQPMEPGAIHPQKGCSSSVWLCFPQLSLTLSRKTHTSRSASTLCMHLGLYSCVRLWPRLISSNISYCQHVVTHFSTSMEWDKWLFYTQDRLGQIGLSTSSTSLGEWHWLLAAWQTPSLRARQRKQLRHRQRAPSTPGEQLKAHNPTEQTALLSTSPHLLQGSGTCKDESVVRDSK